MAGFYPDVPAPRMPYDRDGTIGFRITSGGVISQMSSADLININNETSDATTLTNGYDGIIFPQLRDIAGWLLIGGNTSNVIGTLQTSANTTNGQDGTWTTRVTSPSSPTAMLPNYRSVIQLLSVTGVKAVRWSQASNGCTYQAIHFYGTIAASQTPDRLRIWHPTLDEPLDENTSADGAYLDWGDVPRNGTQDRTLRIKNNSGTLTANSINITSQALTDASPSVPPQFTFSNGGAFGTTLAIGNLSPGQISGVITVRRTTLSNAALGLWAFRSVAEATSWS